MKKSIYILTAALALASPYSTSEAKAGNPFIETQQRIIEQRNKSNTSQPEQEKPVVIYREVKKIKPAEETLVDLTKRTSDKYVRYANLEQRAEEIPTPIPQPPVPQEYPDAQYTSQPQYIQIEQPEVCKKVQPMPEVCKPVQRTPMIIQGAPEIITQPQVIYAPTIVLPSPTVVAQAAVPVVPVQPIVESPGYYETCVRRPFGGLFRGIGIGLRWLFAGPRHHHVHAYSQAVPYYHAPMMGFPGMGMQPFMRPGMGMPFAPGFVPGSFMGGRPGMPYPYRPYPYRAF